MSKTMQLDIVSAEAELFSGQVQWVFASGEMGELGISAGHTPLLSPIKPGAIRAVLDDGSEELFYVSGGVLEVQPDQVHVLADTAQRAKDLDEAAALEAQQAARQKLSDQKAELDYSAALSELAAAAAQIRLIQAIRGKKAK